jgi:hypothetical protein
MGNTPGRAFLEFAGPGEQGAFCAWLSEKLNDNGGRHIVGQMSGVHHDTLSKYISGRSIPSRMSLEKLIAVGVIGYSDPESLAADTPWLADKYVEEARNYKITPRAKSKPKAKAKTAPAPAPAREVTPAPELQVIHTQPNLMDAVMDEPGLTARQRATLVALIAMVVNGVEIDISISPRP